LGGLVGVEVADCKLALVAALELLVGDGEEHQVGGGD